jgi:hypothetical protein
LTCAPVYAETGEKDISVTFKTIGIRVNDVLMAMTDADGNTVQPFIHDGTTYVPIRGVANLLKKAVSWDSVTSSVMIMDGQGDTPIQGVLIKVPTAENSIRVSYNDIKIYVNGTAFEPQDAIGRTVEPFIYNGTTYVPLRAVSKAFGMDVSYTDTGVDATNPIYEIAYIDIRGDVEPVSAALWSVNNATVIESLASSVLTSSKLSPQGSDSPTLSIAPIDSATTTYLEIEKSLLPEISRMLSNDGAKFGIEVTASNGWRWTVTEGGFTARQEAPTEPEPEEVIVEHVTTTSILEWYENNVSRIERTASNMVGPATFTWQENEQPVLTLTSKSASYLEAVEKKLLPFLKEEALSISKALPNAFRYLTVDYPYTGDSWILRIDKV